jgi:hypothetical protein
MKRWRKAKSIPVAEGQTLAFDDDGLPIGEPITGVVYICRECYSRRIVGPIVTTMDPRWVLATCLDCTERTIATVRPTTPSPKEDIE